MAGVTALIYDQTCAAEKRRRRKRVGAVPGAGARIFINERVRGLRRLQPEIELPVGGAGRDRVRRKRAIDQFTCNLDYQLRRAASARRSSPSKVAMLQAARPRRGARRRSPELPEPTLPALDTPYGLLLAGVGGTGVVTIGALIGMAAHLEGKAVSVLDMTGLAQKGGAVMSHVRIAARQA